MIVGIKTERFITVQRHTNTSPMKGYLAFGIEVQTYLHATKGWRKGAVRRQPLGPCNRSDVHRAATQGSSIEFKSFVRARRDRGIASIPITEKMLMRHGWYRRKLRNEKPDADCYR